MIISASVACCFLETIDCLYYRNLLEDKNLIINITADFILFESNKNYRDYLFFALATLFYLRQGVIHTMQNFLLNKHLMFCF